MFGKNIVEKFLCALITPLQLGKIFDYIFYVYLKYLVVLTIIQHNETLP